ncbi:hypothetical protein I3842_05G145600 [Carya illinoinensis]|uniref:WAT1-related protein n=1 Tax=Carya illinoinensis TaxID=32201 RepID=A0A922EZY5_CARIL|nr:hypothetical protein I3842_05G145600 [Carya illinoinensis]
MGFSRFEKLDLRVKSSRARCIGTIASITGALIVTLYKGLRITVASLPIRVEIGQQISTIQSNGLLEAFLLAFESFLHASKFNIQTWIIREYPLGSTHRICHHLIDCREDPNAWKLSLNMELIAIGYSNYLICVFLWAFHEKGPMYVAMFNPLGKFIAVVMGVTFLGDPFILEGMLAPLVIGAAIIVPGFYAVIWGQTHQEKKPDEDHPISSIESSSPRVPLLQNKSTGREVKILLKIQN